MPFFTPFYSSCLVPADTSIHSAAIAGRSKSSLIPTSLYRRFFKKRLRMEPNYPQLSTQKPPARKRSSKSRKLPSTKEYPTASMNYDMTILHEDELQNVHLATHRRRVKKIPAWANQDQLELAVINQVYFQNLNPEDIFGAVSIDSAREMIDAMMVDRS